MTVEINGVEVSGEFDDKFAPVVERFAANIADGLDVGACFALSIDGEMVMDIWGGHRDAARSQPWEQDTIANVYSSTKAVSFLCALTLASRGKLDFDANVADYWPEFAQAGKSEVKVWHLMNHAAGLSGLDTPVTTADLYDWDKVVGLLAAQAPWWEPGSATGYHAITQGWLVGEVVRRVSGKPIGTFLREDIAGPLQADFHIGLPESEFHRVTNLIPDPNPDAPGAGSAADSIAARTFANPAIRAEDSWTPEWRKAEIPAAGGHGNARALVRLHTPLANGGSAFGVDLLDEATAKSVMVERIAGKDLVLDVPLTFGLGYGLSREPMRLSPNDNACYWGGWGGSSIMVDQDAHLAVSFVMNQMVSNLMGDARSFGLVQTVYAQLG